MVRMSSAFSQTAFASNGSSSVKFTTALLRLTPSKEKSLGEFLARHQLAIVLGRPAEQAEEIHERVREETGIAIGGDGNDRAVNALRELGSIGRDEQREVRELRRLRNRRL